jgi:two-component system, sensor histidine kinase PdtaS
MELLTPALPVAAASLGVALVVSSHTPLVLLDANLVIVAASSSFCSQFGLIAGQVVKRSLFDLGQGEWDIAQLRSLLRATASGHAAIDAYECDLARSGVPRINLMVHAHKLDFAAGADVYIVLAVADVTELRRAEQVKNDLIRDKQNLLFELQHRVANSLQIIASVLMQSARHVQSEEAAVHLQDAHYRVMSIATLQRMLAARGEDEVVLATYLSNLCASIAASMIADSKKLRLIVTVDQSRTSADVSVSLGLIVTELVINALKHAYSRQNPEGTITVSYTGHGEDWVLTVRDDGVGMPAASKQAKPGLGTGIVEALAGQLEADIVVSSGDPGTLITITHGADRPPKVPPPKLV